jgi:hypothetical protein
MAQAPFVITPALVAIAIDYQGVNARVRGYVQDQVAPRIRVDGPLFKYPVYNINEAFTVVDNQIDRLGRANELGYTAGEQTGATIDYALREPVPYRDEAAARNGTIPFPLRARAVRNVIDKNQLNREIRVAAMAMSASSYSAGYITDLAGGTKWSDYNNSDPVAQIVDAQAGMLIPGNVGVTSKRVANILRRHPKVAVALGGSLNSGRYYPLDEVATVLGLDRIVVGNTLKQTSKRGQALTTGNIWPDSFAIHYQGPTGPDGLGVDVASPNFLTTFQWGDVVSSETTFDPGDLGLWGGVKVLTGESIVEKAVAPFAGYLFANVLAAQ